nr:hypothetical protein [Bradyrhizobium sp. BR 10289]
MRRRALFARAAAVSGLDGDRVRARNDRASVAICRAFSFSWRDDDRLSDIARGYEPDKLMGYCVAFYFAKLLVWDKVLGLGSTDALAGFAAITANLVVSFYFAKRGFENVARIIKR